MNNTPIAAQSDNASAFEVPRHGRAHVCTCEIKAPLRDYLCQNSFKVQLINLLSTSKGPVVCVYPFRYVSVYANHLDLGKITRQQPEALNPFPYSYLNKQNQKSHPGANMKNKAGRLIISYPESYIIPKSFKI